MQIHNAVITGSFSYNGADLSNVTSSNAYSASLSTRVSQIEQVYATTGSNSFRATQSITGSLTVTGQIVAQSLNVQQVTSSIVFSSGSNTFGCDLNSRQTFTGSVNITGSLIVNNSLTTAGTIYGRTTNNFPSNGIGYYGIKTNNFDAERGGITLQVSCTTNTLIDALTINYLGAAKFSNSVCVNNNLIIVDGSNSLYAWTSCSTFQPGLYGQICVGSAYTGVYTKMYGSGVNAGLFGLSTECMGFVGTDGACGKGLIIGTANNAPIYVGTNNAEAFRVTTNQYLLLGSTQNAYKLEVTAPTNTVASYFRAGGTSGYAAVAFSGDGGTVGVLTSTGCHLYLGTANNTLGNQFGTHGEFMIQKGFSSNVLKLTCTGKSFFTGNVGVVGVTDPSVNLNVGHPDHGIGISYMGGSALPSLAGLYTDNNASGGGTGYGDLIVKARTDYGGFYGVNFFTSAANNTPLLRMRVNSSGQIITPYQPAFMAYGNGNSTIDANGTYLIFPSVQMNRGGHYNTSNGIFTVPVAGVYYFSWSMLGNNTNDIYRFFIRVNDTTFIGDYHLRQDTTETGTAYPINANRDVIMNLAANDTVRIWFRSDAGSQPYGVNDTTNSYWNFMGYLIG